MFFSYDVFVGSVILAFLASVSVPFSPVYKVFNWGGFSVVRIYIMGVSNEYSAIFVLIYLVLYGIVVVMFVAYIPVCTCIEYWVGFMFLKGIYVI